MSLAFRLQFDRRDDPRPLPAELAAKRGYRIVNIPTSIGLLIAVVAGLSVARYSLLISIIIGVIALPGAWIWWSFVIPRWRHWAVSRGADPIELQRIGEEQLLLWPKGSFLEKTEFKINGEKL